jgi:scyllo-inositol 2-dehydrogenase (NADP+)
MLELLAEIIRVGLAGFGVAGRTFHAPVIRAVPGLRLTSIVQRRGNTARETYPDVRAVPSVDELLADEAIRLVVIATPNASHYPLAMQCLLAGRDVVVDKPFTTTSSEAQELDELARSKGRVLSVYQNRRWDGDFLTVQRLIGSGDLGRLAVFESHYDRYRLARRPGAWREAAGPGSGVLFDIGSHLVDQALTLFGMPEAIAADVRIERDDAVVDDAFDIMLRYPKLRVLLRATMLACAPGPRFVLNGTLGTYIKYGMDPQEDALKAGTTPGIGGWGEEDETHWGTLTLSGETETLRRALRTEVGDYRQFYANVRDAISGRAPLIVTAEQATRVIRLLELARESSKQWLSTDCFRATKQM